MRLARGRGATGRGGTAKEEVPTEDEDQDEGYDDKERAHEEGGRTSVHHNYDTHPRDCQEKEVVGRLCGQCLLQTEPGEEWCCNNQRTPTNLE